MKQWNFGENINTLVLESLTTNIFIGYHAKWFPVEMCPSAIIDADLSSVV